MKTNVYVDGLNLYYGALRGTNLKWLDLSLLCATLLPNHTIKKIKYFTAIVRAFDHDPQAPNRQQIYLRALATVPQVSIYLGKFKHRPGLFPQYPLAYIGRHKPPIRGPQKVQILRLEEKISDVALASNLIMDCYTGDFDKAVVISNDADLVPAIKIVAQVRHKPVTIVNPYSKYKINQDLVRVATHSIWEINKSKLAACQFPNTLSDKTGPFTKPSSW